MTIKILFNNSCNICRAEVNHYKKHCNEQLEWIDVSTNMEAQHISSKSFKELLRRMHVIKDGKLIEGAPSINFPSLITCILLRSSLKDLEEICCASIFVLTSIHSNCSLQCFL